MDNPRKDKRPQLVNQVLTHFLPLTKGSSSTQDQDNQVLVEPSQTMVNRTHRDASLPSSTHVQDDQVLVEPFQTMVKRTRIEASLPSSTHIQDDQVLVEPSQTMVKRTRIEVSLPSLPSDPDLRPPISHYQPNDQELVQREYIRRGTTRPQNYNFPGTFMGDKFHYFVEGWFLKYRWLEYSINKDATFCLPCYLFKPQSKHGGSNDVFSSEGFTNWKNSKRLQDHVGNHNSAHNYALKKAENLMKQSQHLETFIAKRSTQDRIEYRIRLKASLDVTRFLLRQGLSFRGHDESYYSINRGNFLELLRFLVEHNEAISQMILRHAPGNLSLTSHEIQTDIVRACAMETVKVLIQDLGDELFSVLIDEARDTSLKEQMAIVLRYVDKGGCVVERFVGIIHVLETSAISLKRALEDFFGKHGLSISRLRGQGYDGANNMQGKFNRLKSLILNENKFAYYVHCFAHRLQLALVQAVKGVPEIASFFLTVIGIVNLVVVSSKHRDNLRRKEDYRIVRELESGEISSGRGLNQKQGLGRPGDTRWGSHYRTLVSLIVIFSSVSEVLEDVVLDGATADQKGEASHFLDSMHSFEFVFVLHLMKKILGITDDLSKALQRNNLDIVNAMALVRNSKGRLQKMRDIGWSSLYKTVSEFCKKHDVVLLSMDDKFMPKISQRKAEAMTNLCHFQAGIFYYCIDKQRVELGNRFNEENIEILLCVTALSPSNRFHAFDLEKLVRLASFYPNDFTEIELQELENQLELYEWDMNDDGDFATLKGISDLAQKLVETGKDGVYDLVYRIIKLSLILPVATATVERAFSTMNIVKNRLRNRMGDVLMNDCLITYIEKEVFDNFDDEAIMVTFQNMGPRRGEL